MRRFCFLATLSLVSVLVMAQTNFQVTLADKQRIVTGSQEYQKDDRVIFGNALMWAIERGEQLKDLIIDCDFDKLRFSMAYNIIRENSTSFASKLTVQVGQGRLVYLVNEIKGQAPGLTGVLGATAFDKMNPDKKPKQKAMIEEFETANKTELASLFNSVRDKNISVGYWNSISANQIEKGMEVSDVILILGKPVDIQKSGDTVQYMYNTFTYVFFENGKVKSFMQ